MSQVIVVCTEDPVLDKKIRFLMSRDQRRVEVAKNIQEAHAYLREHGADLAVFAREMAGQDMIAGTLQLDAAIGMPVTVILGGTPEDTPNFIRVIPDPVDAQEIYRIADAALTDLEGSYELSDETSESPIEHTVLGPPPEIEGAAVVPGAQESAEDFDLDGFSDILAAAARDDEEASKRSQTQTTDNNEVAVPLGGSSRPEPAPSKGRFSAVESAIDDVIEELPLEALEEIDVEEHDIRESESAGDAPRAPRSSVPFSPNLQGTTQTREFGTALFRIARKQHSGHLKLKGPSFEINVSVRDGFITGVETNEKGERLGRRLVEEGRITESQYAMLAIDCLENGCGLVEVLLAHGLMNQEDVQKELGQKAFGHVSSSFSAGPNGHFEFARCKSAEIEPGEYELDLFSLVSYGITQANSSEIEEIYPNMTGRYFRCLGTTEDLAELFDLTDQEQRFLEFSGRAYNAADAADLTGVARLNAHRILALLSLCEMIEDFTPGVSEFEARLAEERERQQQQSIPAGPVEDAFQESPSSLPASEVEQHSDSAEGPATDDPEATQEALDFEGLMDSAATPTPTPPFQIQNEESEDDSDLISTGDLDGVVEEAIEFEDAEDSLPEKPSTVVSPNQKLSSPLAGHSLPPPPPVATQVNYEPPKTEQRAEAPRPETSPAAEPQAIQTPEPTPPAPAPKVARPAATTPSPAPAKDPAMPSSRPGASGQFLAPISFADPAPRGPTGKLIDTPERRKSREIFQRAVTLLGKGKFLEAEKAFREAIILCSDEHVYMVGLARALYYNPNYERASKISVLQTVIARARGLAPDDKRIAELQSWVDSARN